MKGISSENRGDGDGKSHCGLMAVKSPERLREEMEYTVKKTEETGLLKPLTAGRLITGPWEKELEFSRQARKSEEVG